MYWCAKPNRRVIEKAKNIPAGYVFLALFLLLFAQFNIFADISVETDRTMTHNTHAIDYSFTPELEREVVISSGMMVPLMDDDSFLGQISSEKFWGGRKKKKSRNISAAQAKKLRAAKINAATRSGVLTTRQGAGGFFGMFSGTESFLQPPSPRRFGAGGGISAGGYRTLCVRLSDGYYWPLSFAASRGRFSKDSRICNRSCAEPARLFVYRNAGGRPEDMVDLKGHRYSDLENAWRYREEYTASRKCSPHPWEEASLAKHRTYVLMDSRSKSRGRRKARLRAKRYGVKQVGKRRLVRVGRLRTMSATDDGFTDLSPLEIDNSAPLADKSVVRNRRVRKMLSAGRASVKVVAGARSQRLVKFSSRQKMRLGRKARSARPARALRRRHVVRTRKKRRPRWAREALGLN